MRLSHQQLHQISITEQNECSSQEDYEQNYSEKRPINASELLPANDYEN
jgi:hypothetical protein